MSEVLIKQFVHGTDETALGVSQWLAGMLGKPKSVVFAQNDDCFDTHESKDKWDRVYNKFMEFTGKQLTVYMYDPFKMIWYKGPGWEVFYVYEYYGSLQLLCTVAARIDDDVVAVQAKLSCFV